MYLHIYIYDFISHLILLHSIPLNDQYMMMLSHYCHRIRRCDGRRILLLLLFVIIMTLIMTYDVSKITCSYNNNNKNCSGFVFIDAMTMRSLSSSSSLNSKIIRRHKRMNRELMFPTTANDLKRSSTSKTSSCSSLFETANTGVESTTTTKMIYYPTQEAKQLFRTTPIHNLLARIKSSLLLSSWKNKNQTSKDNNWNMMTIRKYLLYLCSSMIVAGVLVTSPAVSDAIGTMTAMIQQGASITTTTATSAASSLSLAGTLWPTLQKLHLSPTKLKLIYHNIKDITEWQEIVILPFIGFIFHPLCQYISYISYRIGQKQEELLLSFDEYMIQRIKNNESNILSWYNISNRIGQIGLVAFSVYIIDVISVIFTSLGFIFPNILQLSSSYAKVAYTSLITSRVLLYKKIALCRLFKVDINDMGQVDVLNRILNGIIVTISTLLIFDWLAIKMGNAITGIFAFGSIGTLAFTLASQGLVTELLSGFILLLGNKISINDDVIFGDGTAGKVLKIGWLETAFRGTDNVETRVPNTMLSSQKVSNVSRVKISQMKHTVRLKYNAIPKILSIINDIKDDIKLSCPHIILDQTIRPFRIYWTSIQEDHIEIMIDTHHKIIPDTDEYYMNQQFLLLAIFRALEKNNIEFES